MNNKVLGDSGDLSSITIKTNTNYNSMKLLDKNQSDTITKLNENVLNEVGNEKFIFSLESCNSNKNLEENNDKKLKISDAGSHCQCQYQEIFTQIAGKKATLDKVNCHNNIFEEYSSINKLATKSSNDICNFGSYSYSSAHLTNNFFDNSSTCSSRKSNNILGLVQNSLKKNKKNLNQINFNLKHKENPGLIALNPSDSQMLEILINQQISNSNLNHNNASYMNSAINNNIINNNLINESFVNNKMKHSQIPISYNQHEQSHEYLNSNINKNSVENSFGSVNNINNNAYYSPADIDTKASSNIFIEYPNVNNELILSVEKFDSKHVRNNYSLISEDEEVHGDRLPENKNNNINLINETNNFFNQENLRNCDLLINANNIVNQSESNYMFPNIKNNQASKNICNNGIDAYSKNHFSSNSLNENNINIDIPNEQYSLPFNNGDIYQENNINKNLQKTPQLYALNHKSINNNNNESFIFNNKINNQHVFLNEVNMQNNKNVRDFNIGNQNLNYDYKDVKTNTSNNNIIIIDEESSPLHIINHQGNKAKNSFIAAKIHNNNFNDLKTKVDNTNIINFSSSIFDKNRNPTLGLKEYDISNKNFLQNIPGIPNQPNAFVSVPSNNNSGKIAFRIKNVIKPRRRNINEINQQYNEHRFLFEKDIDLFSRKKFDYMTNQNFIQPRMRKILLDWIIEVSSQLNFKRSTYHMAVALLDTFLSKYWHIPVNKLQLTGVTTLIIAAKFEV